MIIGSGSRSTLKPPGKYFLVPSDLAEGKLAYVLLDIKGRTISRPQTVDDDGNLVSLISDHQRNLHVTHAHNIQSVSVTNPGVAYANGVNALCLGKPSDEDHHLELVSVYLSTNVSGSFYIVSDDLDIDPGSTTTNTFDLAGIRGNGVTQTCDVIWATYLANQRRGTTGGEFHWDLPAGEELYFIAPNELYTLVINWIEEKK